MYKIIKNEEINKNIFLMEIEAPLIKNKFKPGEFVIVMNDKKSERIPLTIFDVKDDIVKIIYQVVGYSTFELSKNNDHLYAFVGPLGNPGLFLNNIEKKIIFVAGGIGVAAVYPQIKYLHDVGKKTTLIYGAKDRDSLILLDELNEIVDDFYITTDDGSYGEKGFVTNVYQRIMNKYDLCVTIGPLIMMKNVSDISNIKTVASLNPIMLDGTGMCGACRLNINNTVKFACVDGPEFYTEGLDFDSLIKRNNIYKTEEGRAYLKVLEGNTHHGGCGNCE